MKTTEAIQTLQRSGKKLFTLSDLRKLLRIESDNTAYKQARVLVQVGLLERAMKGVFVLSSNKPSDFELANLLCRPSYVSLESALNYYGMLIQSPQQVTSVTTQLTRRVNAIGKEFSYVHLDQKYYSHYQKVDGFLIATPEKAFVDACFLAALGRATLHVEELLLDDLNRKQVSRLVATIAHPAMKKFFALLDW